MSSELYAKVSSVEAEVLAFRWADRAVRVHLPPLVAAAGQTEASERLRRLPELVRSAQVQQAIALLREVAEGIAPSAVAPGDEKKLQAWTALNMLGRLLRRHLTEPSPNVDLRAFGMSMGTLATMVGVGEAESQKQLADLVTLNSNRVRE
jgi:hypothetical protein